MVRKCATFAFGLALLVALGFAMARMEALRFSGASAAFSAPCGPASPAVHAADEGKVVSTLDSTFSAEDTETTAGLALRSRVETVAQAIRRVAPRGFPPLLHRPPPANS